MTTFKCRDCKEFYPISERFTIQEIPGKGFCEPCSEEVLEGWREDDLFLNSTSGHDYIFESMGGA